MIERLTDEMIEKEFEYYDDWDIHILVARRVREHYETILKDLFYITPIEWRGNSRFLNGYTPLFYYEIDIRNKNYLRAWDVLESNYIVFRYFENIEEAQKAAESHRMEQMIAQGLRKMEI